jgi:multiple sugar transport system substrate-binding protein
MFKRTTLITALMFIVIAAMMIAVSSVSVIAQDATATPAPTATNVVSTIGSGNIQISLWDGLTGSDGATFDAMLSQYVTEHPEVSITDEQIAWNTFYAKLQAAFVAGNPPDMFVFHAAEIPVFASQGLLMPTDDLFDNNGGPLPAGDFADPAWSMTEYDGQRYGVLLDNHGFGTWTNDDLLTKAGLDPTQPPPTNYADIVAWLQKLTLDANGHNAADPAFDPNNVVQWGYQPDWVHYGLQSFFYQNGGQIISDDGKTAVINSPENVRAFQSYLDLIYKYHVSPPQAPFVGFNPWTAYAGGQLAVVGSGTWFLNFANSNQWKYHAWPMLQLGDHPGVMFGAHSMQIPAGLSGDKLDAVKSILVWLSNHDDLWASSGQVPARTSIRDALDPAKYQTNMILGQQFAASGHMEAQSPAELEIVNAEDPDLSAAWVGQMTAQEALDDANQKIQQILDRTNAGG